jgi:hypothetical protein
MKELLDYIATHTGRGECQCGCDKQADRTAPPHSVDVCFFWVSARNNPTAAELRSLLQQHYPQVNRLREGPSYIEIGAELGDQGAALLLIGLGGLVGLWKVVTPAVFGFEGEEAKHMAGMGMVMCTGLQEAP